uniref:Integrase catalytic domain-containing protein n=1 Tax=Cajanus cajan TaxID=3821 RepID=A0A151RUE1_CAJCA|nr:hypothetical protein KK1_032262 [Cajanus cajan]
MLGMNLLGTFPSALKQQKFVILVVNYFMEWLKVESLATISTKNMQKCVRKNIITRLRISHSIIIDNSLQFTNKKFNELLQKWL